MIRVALIGNPNCGKTTLFNNLTGSSLRVGNFPGTTVSKAQDYYLSDSNILILDLPGVYSLTPYTPEEKVTFDALFS